MRGHLGLQRGLQHRLGDISQQTMRTDQRRRFGLGPIDQLLGR
jgi:hypothetical protein